MELLFRIYENLEPVDAILLALTCNRIHSAFKQSIHKDSLPMALESRTKRTHTYYHARQQRSCSRTDYITLASLLGPWMARAGLYWAGEYLVFKFLNASAFAAARRKSLNAQMDLAAVDADLVCESIRLERAEETGAHQAPVSCYECGIFWKHDRTSGWYSLRTWNRAMMIARDNLLKLLHQYEMARCAEKRERKRMSALGVLKPGDEKEMKLRVKRQEREMIRPVTEGQSIGICERELANGGCWNGQMGAGWGLSSCVDNC